MMKRKQKAGYAFLAMLLLLLFSAMNVLAAENTAAGVIPVSCVGENSQEVFQYECKPETEENQEIQSKFLSLSDGDTGNFEITYDCPGIYHYSIQQIKGSDPDTTYDSSVYQVDVYVTSDDAGVLHVSPVVYQEDAAEKKMKIEFVNRKITETMPETTAPETTAPETTAPETTAPEATAPETTAPETTAVETTAPSSVPTGDPNTIYFFWMLFTGSGCMLAFLFTVNKKEGWK